MQLNSLTYSYDAAGNRTQVGGTWARTGLPQTVASATYNAANHQLTFGSQTLTYDLNGNLTSDGTNTYTWNARNQLVAINGASVTASFGYDGLGRRRTKTINSTTTDFLYDGPNPVQELSGATVLANIFAGLGVDEYFTRTDSGGTRALLTDALGSTVALVDNAGTIQTQYTYEAFGAGTVSGATSTNPFQYTGRENDGPTGLYYYRARYYSPGLGRFVSEDPIGTAGGINVYEYVGSNPINRLDPLGLVPCQGRWVPAGWDRVFNVVCLCYWLCVPCEGPVIWGGNPRTLPSTFGTIIHTGRDARRGDTCFCPNKPGPERDCRCPSKSADRPQPAPSAPRPP